MTDTIAPASVPAEARPPLHLHPLALRVMHWINAVAMLVMILSGWATYNDEVIFGWLHFPHWMTLGDGPEGALQWHFLAMWILMANGIAYLVYGLASGRFRRMLLPVRIGEIAAEVRAALALRLSHDDLTRYNAVQRVLYIGIILIGILQVLSGLAIWKPVQLSELAALFYDFQTARLVHFLCMAAIVGFLVVHVTLALIVPRTLVAMLTGGPLLQRACELEPQPSPADPTHTTAEEMPVATGPLRVEADAATPTPEAEVQPRQPEPIEPRADRPERIEPASGSPEETKP
jgi:thiosulfate reductase cytochrome b subunit